MSRIDAVGIAAQSGSGPNWTGTKKTTMEFFPPVEEASPGPNFEEMEASETLGSRFPTDREVGGIYYEPSASGKVRATWLPRLLSAFMCDPVTTTVAPGVYSHVLDPTAGGATQPRAQSVLVHRGDPVPPITDLFWDALGQELTLSVEANDWLSFEASWVARAMDATQPAPTVIQDLTRRFPFYTICAFVKIGGGAEEALAVQEFESVWNSNIDTDAWQLCSRDLFRVAPGNVDLEVSFTPLQDLSEYYRRAFLTEPESVSLRLLAQGPLIDATNKHEIEITLARLIETEVEADVNAEETLLGVPVTTQAAIDPTTGDFCTIRVQNAVASYAVV